MDNNTLLKVIRINGLSEVSTQEQIESILKPFQLSNENKESFFNFLRTQGFSVSASTTTQVAPMIPSAPNNVQPPTIQALNPVPNNVQSNIHPATPIIQGGIGGQFVPSATTSNSSNISAPIQKASKSKIFFVWSFSALVVVFVLAFVFFLYKSGFFMRNTYSEDNILSGVISKMSDIKTSSYKVSASLEVVQREADAVPFVMPAVDRSELEAKYKNDVIRTKDASSILSYLNTTYGDTTITNYDAKTKTFKLTLVPKGKIYPSTISDIQAKDYGYSSYNKYNLTDPVTHLPYSYSVTEGGKNFSLVVDYDTDEAVSQLKNAYNYIATTTIINKREVTFTKGSSSFVYIPSTIPLPLIAQLTEEARMLSSDLAAHISFGAKSDMSKEVADWLFNLSADGSFGDLTYAVDVEARKKDGDFYFIINKMPDLFGSVSQIKGKWIELKKEDVASTTDSGGYNSLDILAQGVTAQNNDYEKNKDALKNELNTLISIADKNKLIVFRNSPKKDKIDGEFMTRYDLQVKKDNLVNFYQDLLNESANNKDLSKYVDEGSLSYLKGDEFNSVFYYMNKNIFPSLWVDADGFPRILEIRVRIVPPDTATQLVGKQAEFVIRFNMSDINKPVSIDRPSDSVPYKTLMKQIEENSKNSLTK